MPAPLTDAPYTGRPAPRPACSCPACEVTPLHATAFFCVACAEAACGAGAACCEPSDEPDLTPQLPALFTPTDAHAVDFWRTLATSRAVGGLEALRSLLARGEGAWDADYWAGYVVRSLRGAVESLQCAIEEGDGPEPTPPAAALPIPPAGTLVRRGSEHGRVLSLGDGLPAIDAHGRGLCVLVQELRPHGGREYWAVTEIVWAGRPTIPCDGCPAPATCAGQRYCAIAALLPVTRRAIALQAQRRLPGSPALRLAAALALPPAHPRPTKTTPHLLSRSSLLARAAALGLDGDDLDERVGLSPDVDPLIAADSVLRRLESQHDNSSESLTPAYEGGDQPLSGAAGSPSAPHQCTPRATFGVAENDASPIAVSHARATPGGLVRDTGGAGVRRPPTDTPPPAAASRCACGSCDAAAETDNDRCGRCADAGCTASWTRCRRGWGRWSGGPWSAPISAGLALCEEQPGEDQGAGPADTPLLLRHRRGFHFGNPDGAGLAACEEEPQEAAADEAPAPAGDPLLAYPPLPSPVDPDALDGALAARSAEALALHPGLAAFDEGCDHLRLAQAALRDQDLPSARAHLLAAYGAFLDAEIAGIHPTSGVLWRRSLDEVERSFLAGRAA